MPRPYSVTRKGRALELVNRVALGPAFTDEGGTVKFTPQEAAAAYKRWVHAWVLPELQQLIPELKRKETLPHESPDPKI